MTVAAVEQQRARFTKKWQLRCPAVAESLKEAGDELFTFLRFPRSQWKALRTTNALERINEEFPPPHQDASESPRPGRGGAAALWLAPERADQVASTRWLSRSEGGEKGSVVTSSRRMMTRLNFSTT
jgi:Transposase, Mutator family